MLGTILVNLLVAGIVWWLIDLITILPAVIRTIMRVVLVLFVVVWFLKVTGLVAYLNRIG